jgi:hypothetical protein
MFNRYLFVTAVLLAIIVVSQPGLAEKHLWDEDVLVHQADRIYGFGMDQADKDTLILVVSDSSTANLIDTLYIYRSTDNGQSWD